MEVLSVLNVTSSNLLPNSRGFVRAFEMVYEDLDVSPTIRVFSSFYMPRSVKGICVSLGGLSGKGPFVYHSNHYKYLMVKFARVNGWWDSIRVLGADDSPLLSPILDERSCSDHEIWPGVSYKRNVLLLRNFKLMDSCTMIKLWLESGKHLSIYLGKF